MRPGEIYLARFPFGAVPGMKLRPVSQELLAPVQHAEDRDAGGLEKGL